MNYNNQSNQLLDAVCRRGVLCNVTVRYWRGCKKLKPEDLGLAPADVDDRLIRLGQKRLVPRDALAPFALIESRAHSLVEQSSFPFLGGIARFVPNPRLPGLSEALDALGAEFHAASRGFVAGYARLRESALAEWRGAARHLKLNGNTEVLLANIEQSFPPEGDMARRFAFERRLFQIAAPESLRAELTPGAEQAEAAEARRRVAGEAAAKLRADLDEFVRESVTALRSEAAKLAEEVLGTIDGSSILVHQRTLNRLEDFIGRFRSLNFAGDEELEATLDRFREDLLDRSAEDYRNDRHARDQLMAGLGRLRETAVELAGSDAQEIAARFGSGSLGRRKLAVA
jgi:hypothetical protein